MDSWFHLCFCSNLDIARTMLAASFEREAAFAVLLEKSPTATTRGSMSMAVVGFTSTLKLESAVSGDCAVRICGYPIAN